MAQPQVKFRCGHWTTKPSTANRCPTTRIYLSYCDNCVRRSIMPRHIEIVNRYREQKNLLEDIIAEKQRIRDAPGALANPQLDFHMGQLTAARWRLTTVEELESAEINLAWTVYDILWPGQRS